MKTTQSVLAAVLAALLFVTPPAGASKAKAKKPAGVKIKPAVQKLMSQGMGELQRGEYTAAISDLTKAVRGQGAVPTYFLLGWAHYQRGFKQGSVETADRDDAQSAIDAYEMALSKDPALAGLPDASKLWFSLALCYEATDSYEKSLEAYKSALNAAPNKALIPLHAARLRLKMKDADKALANLEMAMSKARKNGQEKALLAEVRRDPSFAPLIANAPLRRALGVPAPEDGLMVAANEIRGEEMRDAVRDVPARAAPAAQDPAVLEKIAQGNLELKFRRYASAINAYHEALAIDEGRTTLTAVQTASVYEKIGTAYNKLGQSDQAIRSLQKSLQQNPMSSGAHYQIALAYAMAGQSLAAVHALKESFSSASGSAELRRLVLLAKTDVELEAARDLPAFREAVDEVADRVALR